MEKLGFINLPKDFQFYLKKHGIRNLMPETKVLLRKLKVKVRARLPSEFSLFLLPTKLTPAEPASESGWLRGPPMFGEDGIAWPAWLAPAGLVGG